jgi:hypothetical protein
MATRPGTPTAKRPWARKRTTGTPRPRTFIVPRQVSWLAGRRFRLAFPGSNPVALFDVGSPLTVAGAAPALFRTIGPHWLPSWLQGETESRKPRRLTMGAGPSLVKENITTYLYRYIHSATSSMTAAASFFDTRACRVAAARAAQSAFVRKEGTARAVMRLPVGDRSTERSDDMARRVVGDRAGSAATRMTCVDTLRERDVDYTFG